MKKTIFAVLLTLCLLLQTAIPVSAKNKTVTISSCTLTTSSAVIEGTTEAHAVMVRIKDASNNIIALQSFAVSSEGTFSASLQSISLTGGATYTISVADYEGGAWTTTEETATYTPSYYDYSEPTPTPTPEPTAAPTPVSEPTFDEIVADNDGDGVKAVFDAGVIDEKPSEMTVVPDPEDENGAALLDALLTEEQQSSYRDEPIEIILSVSSSELSTSEEKAYEEGIESLEALIGDGQTSGEDITVPDVLNALFSGTLSAPANEDGKTGKPEIKTAAVYDFTVSVKIGKNDPVEVHDLGAAKMVVNFLIDKALKNTDPNIRRIFFMLHLKSGGETEVLPVDVNAKTMKAAVEFSSCSPFILAYTDVAEYTEAGDTLRSATYNARYKVLEGGDANGKIGKLEYLGPSKKEKTVTVNSKVTINGITYKVTSIAAKAFKGNKKVETVKIGQYVTKIGNKAFYGCTALKTVKIGKRVAAIGEKAFAKTSSLKKVTILSTKLKAANIGQSVFSKAGSSGKAPVFEVPAKKLTLYFTLFGTYGTVKKSK